ncbi:hypothetical protein TVAG_207290 [Trichomonas vaginalis G3]|uniref:DUF3447 domain-containing protein n=1 Tax=Trichomonas vaginalis (strain ATCC PRA-98 / G3) TaxID=412133 RepID=A2G472_TRIV3|nr:protein kinase protein [Trichomonas vaginalis G3]EAX88044.1 hypothetical protein TVAG_207290 [Trichomonas vaginalis G3]KAI5497940.1 protein kinase protein [Trichomonas vaginalis G3]|eukprot:XP_001300974.1 hypothetical protein [Trichomonas vaginalis G3]
MSEQDIHPKKYYELRSIYEYYIDSYNGLYKLKTENEEELSSIYKMIKTNLIDSKKYIPQLILKDILNIIPYNNRYIKSYLSHAKFISDDYHVKEVSNVRHISNLLFYKEYGIKLGKSYDFGEIDFKNLDIHTENTIYKAIMYDDKERFITFTETDDFDEKQKLESELYPYYFGGLSLLELCCYHGAVDCFKLLRTKFDSEITQTCLHLSFLGGNPDIISECLNNQKPDKGCMTFAIISHNIDFVTFLMNKYNIEIDLYYCGYYQNLETFLIYFDQTNDINKVFVYSATFDIPSLCKYFLSHGVNINEKAGNEKTALHSAAQNNSKETAELLISYGANINEKDKYGQTALHIAVENNSKETVELLISHGSSINEKDKYGNSALHYAVEFSKELTELLVSRGANINDEGEDGKTAFQIAAERNNKEIA